ncbi:FAD-dependent thymidylate synthase [Acidobacteriota bacterium]
MKVLLAGYNLDSSVIEDLKGDQSRADVTPETLSASYARISRDARPVDELRAVARREVGKARRSNQNIIFKMGHHSVAEHAVFNFDILEISRLAIEELERFRLCSFTEKSQRYVTLENDYVVPEEVVKAGLDGLFVATVKEQNVMYHRLYKRLKPHVFDAHPELARSEKKHHILDGWAKEDARYAVCLATEGQLGMTLNARNLEHMIRRMACSPLAEIRNLKGKLHDLVKEVAPSIILFTEASDFDSRTYDDLKDRTDDIAHDSPDPAGDTVRLVNSTQNGDTRLVAALLQTSSRWSFDRCLDEAGKLSTGEQKEFIKTAFQHMEFYDSVLREFEHLNLTFELVMSATCFAQLKRHRMATITTQKYDPILGVAIPPSIREVGEEKAFMEVIERSEEAFFRMNAVLESGAEYILTNAHRKRVLLHVNARELYHISRLREDPTAQWDIREVSERMSDIARQEMPLTFLLLGGKDGFPSAYQKVFGHPPKLQPPPSHGSE